MRKPLKKSEIYMSKNLKWDGKAKGSSLGNLIFVQIISLVGILPAYFLLFFVSWYYAFFDRKSIVALKEFRKRVGFKSTHIWQLHRHFFSFGVALIDRVAFLLSKKQRFSYNLTNEKYLLDSLKLEKGVIILSGHVGNWEIAGNYLYDIFKLNINVVMMDNEQQNIKNIFKSATSKRRFKTILMRGNGIEYIIKIKEALNNNEVVCFHGDRVLGSSGVKMPFLGKNADFPAGPFQIAAITEAPIIPFFLVKEGYKHYCTKVYKPLLGKFISKEKRNQEINSALKSYISILEDMARKYPYQWYNFYDFWENSIQD